jgi:hypothetical protein
MCAEKSEGAMEALALDGLTEAGPLLAGPKPPTMDGQGMSALPR